MPATLEINSDDETQIITNFKKPEETALKAITSSVMVLKNYANGPQRHIREGDFQSSRMSGLLGPRCPSNHIFQVETVKGPSLLLPSRISDLLGPRRPSNGVLIKVFIKKIFT